VQQLLHHQPNLQYSWNPQQQATVYTSKYRNGTSTQTLHVRYSPWNAAAEVDSVIQNGSSICSLIFKTSISKRRYYRHNSEKKHEKEKIKYA